MKIFKFLKRLENYLVLDFTKGYIILKTKTLLKVTENKRKIKPRFGLCCLQISNRKQLYFVS